MTSSLINNSNTQQHQSILDRLVERQDKFDNFMEYFSSPDMFATELFNLHSMDASEEATRLLADCIEANWIIFGGSSNNNNTASGTTSSDQQQQQQQQPSSSVVSSLVSINNGNDISLNDVLGQDKQQQQTTNDEEEEVSED